MAGLAVLVVYVYAQARDKETLIEGCKACIWITWFYVIAAYFAKASGGIVAIITISATFVFVAPWLIRIWRDCAEISKFKKWQEKFHEEERES